MRLLAICLLLAVAVPAFAAEEKPVSTPDPTTASDPTAVQYRFGGFIRMEGGMVENDPSVAFIGRNDGFRLANARLHIAGQWRDRLSFKISADGAEDERQSANATEGQLRFALKDAYADLRLSRLGAIRSGQFHTIFDIDELGGTSELAFADRSLEARGVRATEGWETPGLAPSRSMGVALRAPRVIGGDRLALGYEIAAQNGNSEDSSANDNDALAYSGALVITFGGNSILYAGARHNRRTVGDLPFREVEEDVSAVAAASIAIGPLRVAGQGIARQTTYPTTGGLAENAVGGHAQILVRIPSLLVTIEPGYRFAMLDPSDLVSTDMVQEHTVGVNFGLDELRTRVQINVTHVVEQAGRELENDRGEIVIQVSL